MSRLGINHGRYCGEGIDIAAVLRDVAAFATESGWVAQPFSLEAGYELLTLRREGKPTAPNVYLSSGIHGDEPAGPLALRHLLLSNDWPADFNLWMVPCINQTGFPLNTRENAAGVDLNRDYRHLTSIEVRTHVSWLQQQPRFDLCLCLHEDWEADGFYVYELNPDKLPSLAEEIVASVETVCPIEAKDVVDGWSAAKGIIRPDIPPEDRPQWAEALFLIVNKTRQSYTLEAPSDFPLARRVEAQLTAVRTALQSLGKRFGRDRL